MEVLDHNNQQVLWNAFVKLPRNEVINDKKEVFHNVISNYYKKYGNNKINIEVLRQINRSIVNDLCHEISKIIEIEDSKRTVPSQKMYFETEEEKTSRYFKEKQEQYELMNKKPKVKVPHELETMNSEGAINNMDEVIQNYENERRKDIPTYNPILTDSSNNITSVNENNYDNIDKRILEIKNDLVSIFERLGVLESNIKMFSKKEKEL
jgi:hypothetical protein